MNRIGPEEEWLPFGAARSRVMMRFEHIMIKLLDEEKETGQIRMEFRATTSGRLKANVPPSWREGNG